MQNKRLRRYLLQKEAQRKEKMEKEKVQANPDPHIDQDFKGYPHAPAKEEVINPRTGEQKKVAAVNTKDGEKVLEKPAGKKSNTNKDEIDSDGSASAFEGTERVTDDE
jgi:hypothetical protein